MWITININKGLERNNSRSGSRNRRAASRRSRSRRRGGGARETTETFSGITAAAVAAGIRSSVYIFTVELGAELTGEFSFR